MVFILFDKSWPRDSPIFLLPSKQGTFVTESIIKCTISDWKFNKECDGNIIFFLLITLGTI